MIVARNPEDNFFYLYHIKPPKSWSQEKTTDLLFWCLENLYFFTDSSHKCDEIPEEFIEAFIQQRSQGEAEVETPPAAIGSPGRRSGMQENVELPPCPYCGEAAFQHYPGLSFVSEPLKTPPDSKDRQSAHAHEWESPPSSWGVLTWCCKHCGNSTYNPSDKGTCYGVVAPDNERKMSLPYQLWCPKCQEQTYFKVLVNVPAGQDPHRVLLESLVGCSPLPQHLVFTCSRCGWTSE